MRDILDINGSRETLRIEHEDFIQRILEEIFACRELNEIDQIDIIRQLESHSL